MSAKYFYIILASVVVVMFATVLVAQNCWQKTGPPFGGPPMPMMGPDARPNVISNSQGVFVLADGKLIKYSVNGLKNKTELQLGEPRTASMRPAISTATGSDGIERLLVITGERLTVVDPVTLQVKAKVALPALQVPKFAPPSQAPRLPGPPPDMPGMGPGFRGHRGGMGDFTVNGDTIYIQRGPQILEINYVIGKLVAKTEIPVPK